MPVDSISSRTATPFGAEWELTTRPSGFEKAVLSVWYFSTAVGTRQITRKGSLGCRGLAVLESIFPSVCGINVSRENTQCQ